MHLNDNRGEHPSQVQLIRQRFETSQPISQYDGSHTQSSRSKRPTKRFFKDNNEKPRTRTRSAGWNRRQHISDCGNIDPSSIPRADSRLELAWKEQSNYSEAENSQDPERLLYISLKRSLTMETEVIDWAELSPSPESDEDNIFSFDENDEQQINLVLTHEDKTHLTEQVNCNRYNEIFRPKPSHRNENLPTSPKISDHGEISDSYQPPIDTPLELQSPEKVADKKDSYRSMNINTDNDDDDDDDDVSNNGDVVENVSSAWKDAWKDPYYDYNVVNSYTGMFLKLSSNFEEKEEKECIACTIM